MHRKLHWHLAAAFSLISLTGCVQATRHSNTMVFGTNTTFGIKAGTATGNIPEVVVGYDRQEAVIMPLVANVASNRGSGKPLEPCDLGAGEPGAVVGSGKFAVHPCSLVAVRDGALDSYSVLASFGAQFSADTAGAPKASGGLAQYFATGLAAQILALKGGAALVAVGEAASQSAQTSDSPALASLLTGDPAFGQAAPIGPGTISFHELLSQKVTSTAQTDLVQRLQTFEKRAGVTRGADRSCKDMTPSACAGMLKSRSFYGITYWGKKSAFDNALANWDQPDQ